MSEWRELKLGELVNRGLAETRTGPFGTQLHASDYTEHGTPVINVRNLGFGDIRAAALERVGVDVQERLAQHALVDGDVVFGRKGAVDRHALVTKRESGWMQGSDCIRFRLLPGSPIVSQFLSKALLTHSHRAWMEAQCSHGSTMASLNQEIISRIVIRAPTNSTQLRIVSVLDAFDKVIDINERRIALLEDLARALYQEWFVFFRFPGHEEVEFVDSELGPIPQAWEVRALCEVASVNRRTLGVGDLPASVRYLDISAVGVGQIGEPVVIPATSAPGRARRELRDGDVVWATVRPNRRAHGLVHDPSPDLIGSTGLAVLSPETVPSSFLFEYASDATFTEYLVSRATGSAYPAVRPSDFERALLVIPDRAVMEAFDGAADKSLRLASSLVRHNRALAATRDLLLPRLVTGRLDISDVNLGDLLRADAA